MIVTNKDKLERTHQHRLIWRQTFTSFFSLLRKNSADQTVYSVYLPWAIEELDKQPLLIDFHFIDNILLWYPHPYKVE